MVGPLENRGPENMRKTPTVTSASRERERIPMQIIL
jgi:hypothetical protein